MDLITSDQRKSADQVAICRIEQLYPFPHKTFAADMKRNTNASEVVCVQ